MHRRSAQQPFCPSLLLPLRRVLLATTLCAVCRFHGCRGCLAAGGVAPFTPDENQHSLELYTPGYLTGPSQPVITTAPAVLTFGNSFTVNTPQATDIGSLVLLAPMSVTHHTDSGQRYVKLPIQSRTANSLTGLAPANGNITPPGVYLLFIVKNNGVPSEGRFVKVG